jgi:hypothetical protein
MRVISSISVVRQLPNDTTIQRSNDPTIQQSNDPTIQLQPKATAATGGTGPTSWLVVFHPIVRTVPLGVGPLGRWEL